MLISSMSHESDLLSSLTVFQLFTRIKVLNLVSGRALWGREMVVAEC